MRLTAGKRRNLILLAALIYTPVFAVVHAQSFDGIGLSMLRSTTNLDGSGIRVAQAEAGSPNWEVIPSAVGQPVSLFTYISSVGSSSTYPNAVGTNSMHATQVATNFYSVAYGVATNVAHVDNYEGNYFFNSLVNNSVSIGDSVVNQSFIFGTTISQQEQVDSAYDNYAVNYRTLFISAVGNGGSVSAPGTSYNCISAGLYGGGSSFGPTLDNGRCKPDIVAPYGVVGPEDSFSTPYVAGAAALMLQAALRGDGGTDTNSAGDIRTLKALLLNGAVKPSDWTNATFSPLDMRYGSGVLNVFNSYKQLSFGKQGYIASTSVTSGNPHPPTGATGTESTLNGWDFNSASSTMGNILTPATDGINHYYFNITNGASNAVFTASVTLVWNRPKSASSSVHSSINNLALFLYNAANSNLVMVSTSMVDNVQHIYVPRLASGRYDLQVWKAGGSSIVTTSESYALAWSFTSPSLSLTKSGSNVNLSWPAYPAGFEVQSTTNLITTPWSADNLPATVFANGTNTVQVPMTGSVQFFRLAEPNF